MRRLLLLAAALVLLAPPLRAQLTTVCVFQARTSGQFDADTMSDDLSAHSLNAVSALGVARRDEVADAQKRNCSWILTLWRRPLASDTPNYSSPFEANSNTAQIVQTRPPGGTLFGYSLRRAGSPKTIAHAEAEDHAPYAKWAVQVATTIGREKRFAQ